LVNHAIIRNCGCELETRAHCGPARGDPIRREPLDTGEAADQTTELVDPS
jgi:hypothetical protein